MEANIPRTYYATNVFVTVILLCCSFYMFAVCHSFEGFRINYVQIMMILSLEYLPIFVTTEASLFH
jgi:hypothetical protein